MNEELNINYYNSNAIPNERKDIRSGGGVCIMPFFYIYSHVWIGIHTVKYIESTRNLANSVHL